MSHQITHIHRVVGVCSSPRTPTAESAAARQPGEESGRVAGSIPAPPPAPSHVTRWRLEGRLTRADVAAVLTAAGPTVVNAVAAYVTALRQAATT